MNIIRHKPKQSKSLGLYYQAVEIEDGDIKQLFILDRDLNNL